MNGNYSLFMIILRAIPVIIALYGIFYVGITKKKYLTGVFSFLLLISTFIFYFSLEERKKKITELKTPVENVFSNIFIQDNTTLSPESLQTLVLPELEHILDFSKIENNYSLQDKYTDFLNAYVKKTIMNEENPLYEMTNELADIKLSSFCGSYIDDSMPLHIVNNLIFILLLVICMVLYVSSYLQEKKLREYMQRIINQPSTGRRTIPTRTSPAGTTSGSTSTRITPASTNTGRTTNRGRITNPGNSTSTSTRNTGNRSGTPPPIPPNTTGRSNTPPPIPPNNTTGRNNTPPPGNRSTNQTATIKINEITEDEITKLLSLTSLQSKYILQEKENNGPYTDAVDFAGRSKLPDRILNRFITNLDFTHTPQDNSKGRVIEF